MRLWKQDDFCYCKFCKATDDDGYCQLATCWVRREKTLLGKLVYAGLAIIAVILLLAIIL